MSVLLAVGVVVVFTVTIDRLSLPERGREVGHSAAECARVLRDRNLDDASKEKVLQRQAVYLFKLLGILTGGSLLALGLPFGGVWLLELLGIGSLAGVLDVLERIDFLAAATGIGLLAYFVTQRFRSS